MGYVDAVPASFDDAVFYSAQLRVMGRLEGVSTTLPEDIPEKMNRWVYKCAAKHRSASVSSAAEHSEKQYTGNRQHCAADLQTAH